jgi:hypothetical protein
MADNLLPSSADVTEFGSLNLPEPSGPHRPVMGLLYLFFTHCIYKQLENSWCDVNVENLLTANLLMNFLHCTTYRFITILKKKHHQPPLQPIHLITQYQPKNNFDIPLHLYVPSLLF